MNIKIVPFEEAQACEIGKLWYDSWLTNEAHHDDSVTAQTLAERLLPEEWDIHLAYQRDRPIGLLALNINPSVLAQLFVARSCQNRGVGRQLLQYAQSKMPDGFSLNTVIENRGARRFYERHGLILDRIEDGKAHYRWEPPTA